MFTFDKTPAAGGSAREFPARIRSTAAMDVGGLVVSSDLFDTDERTDDLSGCVAVPFHVVREKHAKLSEPCWGCIHAFRKPDDPEKDPIATKMHNVIEKNQDTTSTEQLSKLLHTEFRELVYIPLRERGQPCMDWPVDVIQRHLEGLHVVSPDAEIRNSVRFLSTVEREMLDNLFLDKEGDAPVKFNEKQVEALCKVSSVKMRWVSMMRKPS